MGATAVSIQCVVWKSVLTTDVVLLKFFDILKDAKVEHVCRTMTGERQVFSKEI